MSWIKRNLYFLVGGIVAVVLLGMAGYYCYSKWKLNSENLAKLEEAYTDWDRISRLPVSSGNDKVDNIKLAREHQQQVREMIRKVSKYYTPIPPIPSEGAAREDFTSVFRSSLLRTIDQLQKAAVNGSVTLTQPNYSFSFKAQQGKFNFPPGSLGPLSVQLGEIKAICDVLFRTKINSLDNLQRERISSDDLGGPQSDYLDSSLVSITNDLAVLTPYVITFRCFSGELANVLAGFGNGPHGFIVKAVNVEPGAGATADPFAAAAGGAAPPMPGYYPGGVVPGAAPPATAAGRGPPVILDERPLKVVLVLEVVKLLPKK